MGICIPQGSRDSAEEELTITKLPPPVQKHGAIIHVPNAVMVDFLLAMADAGLSVTRDTFGHYCVTRAHTLKQRDTK